MCREYFSSFRLLSVNNSSAAAALYWFEVAAKGKKTIELPENQVPT